VPVELLVFPPIDPDGVPALADVTLPVIDPDGVPADAPFIVMPVVFVDVANESSARLISLAAFPLPEAFLLGTL
jgi:hypothetical protein